MATREEVTVRDMLRAAPIETALITAVPLGLALLQLANSAFNSLSFFVSVPFSIVAIGFSWFLIRYSFARFQRRQIERIVWE